MRSAWRAGGVRGEYLEPENAFSVVVRGIVQVPGDHKPLPELLLECHPAEEVADPVGDRQARVPVRRPFGRRRLTQHRGGESCRDDDWRRKECAPGRNP